MARERGQNAGVRSWVVASALIEGPDGLLLVQNRRRDGRLDWSTPGGVIEVADGESIVAGLTREVREETGITVHEWEGPVYEVECVATGLGWQMRAEVHRAVRFDGELEIDDPDAIVVDARYVAVEACAGHLASSAVWVHEPLGAWLTHREGCDRSFRYRVDGESRDAITVTRL